MATRRTARESDSFQGVHQKIEKLQKPMVDFLRRFCGIATVNPPGDCYVECVEFLRQKMDDMGLETRIVRVPRSEQEKLVPGSSAWPRLSVIGRWNVGAKRTLLMTGHYDVVPPTSGWKSDPFKPVVKGRKLYARGASDMKAANTAAIFTVQAMRQAGFVPPWNIELAFTPDEETGGYAGLGYCARSGQFDADAAVLLEGGYGLNIGYAHRGVLWVKITVLGRAGHAANPKNGVNALEKAMGLIQQLKTLEPVYAKRRSAFRTEKPISSQPTMMIGGISGGGNKINTIPDRFSFTIDRRLRPEDKLSEVKAEIMSIIRKAQKRDKDLKVEVEYPLYVEPGWTKETEMICQVAQQAVRDVYRKPPRFRMSGGFNDMHFLTRDAKIPTVGYGTEGGGGAHGDDEYQEIPGMIRAARVYAEIIRRLPAR